MYVNLVIFGFCFYFALFNCYFEFYFVLTGMLQGLRVDMKEQGDGWV